MNVVTGGLGFIGNELVRQLLGGGEEVVIIDNENRRAPDIADIAEVRVEKIDICDNERIIKLLAELKPEKVFHLAAIHFIPECNAHPERTLRINVEGTQSMLNASAKAGVGRFLFASSGAVYADSESNLTEQSLVKPVDVYGLSKLFGEQLCEWFADNTDLMAVCCRLFNNYGPRETNAHIVPEIFAQLSKGDVLKLGNIKPVRDYIHTSDCAKAFIKLSGHKSNKLEKVNVATGTGYSVEDMIEKIRRITGRDISIERDESRYRKIDKMSQVASIEYLEQLTGWKPEVNINKGLEMLVHYEKLTSTYVSGV
jgi:UDP-glucose 4-epimerase